jgi:uncharacterized protein (TIGR01244 family)
MEIRKVTDSFAVSPQIRPEDVQTLADEGYKTIICNRPDDEEFGQPLYESVAARSACARDWTSIMCRLHRACSARSMWSRPSS